VLCSRIAGRKSRFTLANNHEPRTWKAWAMIVVAACAAIHGQSSPRQMADPAVAALGSGFVSDTARVNGATLHYVRGGVGPAVILLHGFPEDWYEYHRIMPQLAKQFTVVAVDLRGIGGSAATAGGYDAANMAEDVHQLAEHLHLEHVYVVGHDIGGMVAYAFARRYPETSRGVMMLDAPLPGLGPWDAVKANPITWHINFQQTSAFRSNSLPVAKPFICAIFSTPRLSAMRMSPATPRHTALLNICVRRWKSIGPFRQMRNSMRRNKAPSAYHWYSLRAKTRLSRSSCRASPMRCGRMVAQTLRSKSSKTANISSPMSSPMLWLNSSIGMPRYNDDYTQCYAEAHGELSSSRREGKEA
jgi:pimeloyl-ACP methyl ester carboxylesterase